MSNLKQEFLKALQGEHTSYTSSSYALSKLHTQEPWVVVGPGENTGIIDLEYDNLDKPEEEHWCLGFKAESHNKPILGSNEFFIKNNIDTTAAREACKTALGGIVRDHICMGINPIAYLDFFRVGDTNKSKKYFLPQMVKGVSTYGNTIGIPTVGGDVYIDPTYNKHPLVNACCLGLIKKKNIIYGRASKEGQDIIYVGNKSGKIGVHGSTMASNPVNKVEASTVQIGDPFLGKLLLDSMQELVELNLVSGASDCGALGLMTIVEIYTRTIKHYKDPSYGVDINLDKIPVSEPMTPLEILINETQERLVLIADPENTPEIFKVFKKWDLESAVIGKVTRTGFFNIFQNNSLLDSIIYDEIESVVSKKTPWEHNPWKPQLTPHYKPDASIIENIWKQYDHKIKCRTIKGPDKPGSYSILDIPEIGKELVITWSSKEELCDIDPKFGVTAAFMDCYSKLISLQAKPLAITNCLNFGHPFQVMESLFEICKRLGELSKEYHIPVISGNVSLYNTHLEESTGKYFSIKPTPVLVFVGLRNRP